MSDAIQFNSRVGDNGVLDLKINLGEYAAAKEVVVTIEPASADATLDAASLSWPEFIKRTYGSLAGLDVERHNQGDFEQREPIA